MIRRLDRIIDQVLLLVPKGYPKYGRLEEELRLIKSKYIFAPTNDIQIGCFNEAAEALQFYLGAADERWKKLALAVWMKSHG